MPRLTSLRPFAVCAVALLATATASVAQNANRQSLDGEWRFTLVTKARDADELTRIFIEPGFSEPSFKAIPVPSNWAMLGWEDPTWVNGSEAEGFYTRTFSVPASAAGQRVLLHFDGVWESAEVWLNGQNLGRHESGFTSFAFDATAALKAGAENRLAVRVRQHTPGFKLDANDDWALAGIYRSVWLEFMPKNFYLERVETETRFDGEFRDADLKMRVFVARNEKAEFLSISAPFEVRATLSREGKEVQRESFTGSITGAHSGRDIALTMHVHEPAQWNAETPNLYDLRVELIMAGKTVHSREDRVGFREVSTAGGVLRINGQVVKLRGVCRHDQHPDVGRATRPQDWEQDVKLMKEANINAVRCSHYPPSEGFLRLCDERGLYVLDEVPFGFGGERMDDPSYAAGVFLRVYETVTRDRNRPSVIVWDLGNEDPLTAMHVAAARALKGLDATRPVLMPIHAEQELAPEFDILAPHYWTEQEYDKLGAAARRPIISTEYTHALGPDDFGGMQQRWDALTKHAAGAGAMIWLWADEGLRRPIHGRPVADPMRDKARYTREGGELVRQKDAGPGEIYDSHGNYGTDGIVDPDRKPQRDYWEAKAVYAPARVLTERVLFAPGQPEVSVEVRNDFDFLNLSTLSIAWKLFRDADLLATGTTSLQAAPHVTATLAIPTTAIKAGSVGAHYLQLAFLRADGSEAARQNVRLGDSSSQAPVAATTAPPKLEQQGDMVAVNAGTARYEFNAKTGGITSISVGGKKLTGTTSLIVWRPATYSERNQLDKRPNQHDWNTFMQNATAAVQSWNVAESGSGVQITARVEYREDALNAVIADYAYFISPTGTLKVALKVEPKLDVPWLPEIGLEFATVAPVEKLAWLGQGPLDSLPNKTAATTFGQWSADASNEQALGTKSVLEWARLSFASGGALRITDSPGVRLIPAGNNGYRFRVFTHLAGAWTKNGLPERPEWRLELVPGRTFEGAFEITPVTAGE